MAVGDNNPRVFADTIALETWRRPFDGVSGEADLHIDVVFREGRAGGPGDPVRFRLSLRHAEVHVMRGREQVIDINRQSVRRAALPEPVKRRRVTEKKAEIGGELGADLSPKGATAAVKAKAGGRMGITDRLERNETVSAMEVTHWPTQDGYAFKIAPNSGHLHGQPWPSSEPVMKIRDTNAKRKRGEPPEVRLKSTACARTWSSRMSSSRTHRS